MEIIKKRDFLIIGHPRGGTGYSSKLFKTFGFDVGHEKVFTSGISSWCFASPKGWNLWTDKKRRNEYYFKWTFLNIRNPLLIINSLRRDHITNKDSLKLSQQWGKFTIESTNELEIAVERYLKWDEFLWKNNTIDFWFRVENQQLEVYKHLEFLGYEPYYHLGKNNINEHIIPRNINTRNNSFSPITLDEIPEKFRSLVKNKMEFYGYE